MKPTYEELENTLRQTEELLKKALEKIAELEERLTQNSKNSSKPPSTVQKGNTPDTNEKKQRKSRAGKARTLFSPDRIDRHMRCTRENCPYCGSSAIHLDNRHPEKLQQAELPEVKAIVTEYELLKYTCTRCGKHSLASLPNGIPDSAFGPKLMGLLSMLTGVMHLSKRDAIHLIKDLYDVDMGVGSVPNIEERVAKTLDPIYDRIHSYITENKLCTHFDETGWRDSGKRHFAWLASSEHAAVYMIDRTRSKIAFQRLIGKKTWNGPAVTDRYGVYLKLQNHQYCLAHLIREFRRYGERDGPDQAIGRALEKELGLSCAIHGEYREGDISIVQRNRRIGKRKQKVRFWLEDGMANGSDSLFKLCQSLLNHFDKLWTFTKITGMEPTNNMAERDLRRLVLWRKKSYGTRSERGKKFVERITTIAQTLRKQERNILSFLQQAVENFYLKTTPPFISEVMGF